MVVIFGILSRHIASSQIENRVRKSTTCPWEICSIDTMKTSRDMARAELYNSNFDSEIKKEVKSIKRTGANYVTIGTPYDSEFAPYMKRWVKAIRDEDLNVWFRGNWNSWEGWFDYPKNMSPDQHLAKTAEYIKSNPDLFEDGDIFDACPECENAGFWPQPEKDPEYNEFIRKQKESLDSAFGSINKDVITNVSSIIGGRSREVLEGKTFDSLGRVAAIDHYFKDVDNIVDYINYFSEQHNSKVLLSEFGAPIPDLHGEMTEGDQANYVNSVLNNLYKNEQKVIGVNYWVLSHGTTQILNPDGSERDAYAIIRKYYSPGTISGVVEYPYGERVGGVKVSTSDGLSTTTNKNGEYVFAIPPREVKIFVDDNNYTGASETVGILASGEKKKANFVVEPTRKSLIYKLKKTFLHITHQL